jgi:class 3 adenylate cyclase
MADTQRFNEAAALPKHQIEEIAQPDGSVEFFATARIGLLRLRWRDVPVSWVSGEWLEHRREFLNGPFKSLTAEVRFVAEKSATSVNYTLSVEPTGILGRCLLLFGFFRSSAKTFSRLAREANDYLTGQKDTPFAFVPPGVSKEQAARVDALVEAIEASPNGHGLARRLADFVLHSQEVDLSRIRPIALARRWGVKPIDAIEVCLQAVRQGLLELRWDLLCPRCRVAKAWSGGLDQLPNGAHCPSCNIDYGRDFSRNVEASFHPSPAIRRVDNGEYCMWGPMSVPHVRVQVALRAGEVKRLGARLAPGPYRARSLEPGPEALVECDGRAFPAIRLSQDHIEIGGIEAAGILRLENAAARTLTGVIEDRRWVEDALTGDRLTALQGFRDLFGDDVLRPGDEVAVGRVALLFSDLQGSTELYQRIGDAPAYHLVREHFALLAQSVRTCEGGIVKTIGDAVMAAFADTRSAISAAIDILRKVEKFNSERREVAGSAGDIIIKLGVHAGPAIVVTLNDRLDYFGSTVNLAARLQGLAKGGEVVLSAEAMAEVGVAALAADLKVERGEADLKGFAQAIAIFRCRV